MRPSATGPDVSRTALVRRARRIVRVLGVVHPDARCELDFTTPLELLVATVLSAQSTDVRVNQVTPELFAAYPDALAYAQADVADVAVVFATEMIRQIRGRLERAFEDGADEQEVGDAIRACYREWKTQRIADTARHFVVVSFSRGVAEAAPDRAEFRWLVDDGDAPCPDCDDNALAGGVPRGEPFPTGDLCPPAHPGCRCLAVPVDLPT